MAFDTLQKSRFILNILTTACILTNKKCCSKFPKCPPIYYKLLVHVPMTFTFFVLMWLEVLTSSDLNQATDALYITLTESGLIVKILSVWYYEELVKSLFNEWHQNGMFMLQSTQECAVWQSRMKVFSYVAYLYFGFSLASALSASAVVLFLNGYRLPFPIWLPFNLQNPSTFWCAYAFETLSMPLSCTSNSILDMLFCYMMQHLALHFNIIALRLESLGTKKYETHHIVTKKLLAIIKLHSKLNSMCKSCETIVMYPILCQISLSALVLCFSLYRLQNFNLLENPIDFLSLALYAVVMNSQIFLFCFYGNKLTLESAALIRSLYNCNWPDMSKENRKLVLQYMQPLQSPVVIRAGNFFNVDLATYTKTMNNAYSFYALLLNMDTE